MAVEAMAAQDVHDTARKQSGANKPKHRPPAVAGIVDWQTVVDAELPSQSYALLLVNHKIIYRLDAMSEPLSLTEPEPKPMDGKFSCRTARFSRREPTAITQAHASVSP